MILGINDSQHRVVFWFCQSLAQRFVTCRHFVFRFVKLWTDIKAVMLSFSISQFVIISEPWQVPAYFLPLSTGSTLGTTFYSCIIFMWSCKKEVNCSLFPVTMSFFCKIVTCPFRIKRNKSFVSYTKLKS